MALSFLWRYTGKGEEREKSFTFFHQNNIKESNRNVKTFELDYPVCCTVYQSNQERRQNILFRFTYKWRCIYTRNFVKMATCCYSLNHVLPSYSLCLSVYRRMGGRFFALNRPQQRQPHILCVGSIRFLIGRQINYRSIACEQL